jgi:RNA polymerase sigma-70 factor, ECF subfamily
MRRHGPQIGSHASPATASAALGDEEVVARVVEGQVGLFEILMRRYNQRVFRVVRGILGDDAEAEDVTQEAYVNAFHSLASFRSESLFSTWLTRIAVHEATARLRRRRRLVAVGEGGGPDRADGDAMANPHRALENRELRLALEGAVDALPESLRTVFVLREVEGLSGEEAAQALGISPENARVRLHRAKATLRRNLDERIGGEVRRLYLFDGERCDRTVDGVLARLGLPTTT